LDQSLPGDLPDTVVAALRVTFRLLTARAQSVLAALSVIGDHVELDVLSSGTGLPPGEIEAALDELESHQWLTESARGYAFTARLSREVISRDMVTAGQRRRILMAARHEARPSNPGDGSVV
jgi:DNA-binding IclR family transcriptional regulator